MHLPQRSHHTCSGSLPVFVNLRGVRTAYKVVSSCPSMRDSTNVLAVPVKDDTVSTRRAYKMSILHIYLVLGRRGTYRQYRHHFPELGTPGKTWRQGNRILRSFPYKIQPLLDGQLRQMWYVHRCAGTRPRQRLAVLVVVVSLVQGRADLR